MALQLVHEAALCTAGVRKGRSLSQKGFELANGLPFVAADQAVHQLRQRLGEPHSQCDATHLAKDLFNGLDGDIRVSGDTICITYYNAPNADKLRHHYENLPDKLARENVSPHIPWLYDFKLDFRFK